MPSGTPLSNKQREKLFRVWMDCQSTAETARKCRVSPVSCQKYMKVDKWVQRKEQILAKAQQSGDDATVYKLTGELKALHVFIQHHISKLADQLKNQGMEVTITNLLNMIGKKQELLKEVEPEVPIVPEQNDVANIFNRMSAEAQRKIAEAAIAQLTKPDDDQS